MIFVAESNEIQMAYKGNTWFEGDASINSSEIYFNNSNGKVILSGENNQALDGTDPYLFCKLEINKTSGAVQLNQQAFIDSTITFESGILYTDSLLTLKATATTSGASNQSFVDGRVKKIGNSAFVFPVGDEHYYYPISISAPSLSTNAFKAQYKLETYNFNAAKDSTIGVVNSCGYWNLTRESGTSNVNVKISWDSLGCGIFETTGLVIANWNGTSWKNIGGDSLTGSGLNGTITNRTSVINYGVFTYGYKDIPAQTPIILKLNTNTNDLNWHHSISTDYLGYNGANVLFDDQTWDDLYDGYSSNSILKKANVSMLRLHGGTVGNYWDWRKGWFIPEPKLPFDWFYFEATHTLPNTGYKDENKMPEMRKNAELIVAKPMFQINDFTSDFHYQLASLYYANELNLPVEYIELGEEYYLNDEHYKEKFPTPVDYVTSASSWCKEL